MEKLLDIGPDQMNVTSFCPECGYPWMAEVMASWDGSTDLFDVPCPSCKHVTTLVMTCAIVSFEEAG